MQPRKVTLANDETFHPQPCLVAIEPVSGFIVSAREFVCSAVRVIDCSRDTIHLGWGRTEGMRGEAEQ
jgi:hypothetical protein